jgi:uncharacterized protein (DUF1810 family)
MVDLDRFRNAQDDPRAGFATALAELRAGHKTSHWIWYILPQLAALGRSSMARRFGLAGVEEATAVSARSRSGSAPRRGRGGRARGVTGSRPIPSRR